MTTKVKRLRLNAEMRKNAVSVVKDFYESKNSKYKLAMQDAKSMYDDLTPHVHKKIVGIVRGYQPQEDVDTINKMIAKYNSNGGCIYNDACFYIGHEIDSVDYNNQPTKKIESKHYDFTLYGSVEGYDGKDFAYAYYRDELKDKGLNPDINAQMSIANKGSNPYWTKHQDANNEYLGYSRYNMNSESGKNYNNAWKEKYQIEVIGRSYCGSRNFQVDDKTYESLNTWQIAKSNVVKTHQAYVEWLDKKVSIIENAFKSYRYFDEIQKACANIECPINESQVHGESSMALSVYAPDNLASLLNDEDDNDDIKAQMIASFKAQRQSVN